MVWTCSKLVQNLFKCVQMCSNLFKTCSNVFKWVQTCSKLAQMSSNVFKWVQNLFKCVKCVPACPKLVQMCSKLFKNYQPFQCKGSDMTSSAWSSLFCYDIKIVAVHAFFQSLYWANTSKNYVFCCELGNARPTKELKAFFAFAENLPTSATQHVLPQSDLRSFCKICSRRTPSKNSMRRTRRRTSLEWTGWSGWPRRGFFIIFFIYLLPRWPRRGCQPQFSSSSLSTGWLALSSISLDDLTFSPCHCCV